LTILVDADAFPRPLRDILIKAATRLSLPTIFVANRFVRLPASDLLTCVVAPEGPDQADDRIVELLEAGDLVITADVPLADRVVTKGGHALNPRGTLYTPDNIKERLASRDLMADLRDSGLVSGGPPAFGTKDVQSFADGLNRFLSSPDRKS
jgi:uncharacterized protein YaiI (UPF0178 family)